MTNTLSERINIPANIRASEGAGTTTLVAADSRRQVFNLSAARTCVLPTTNIAAGDTWYIENRGDFDLTIQASGGSALTVANSANLDATIRNGEVVLIALQAAPTTPAHWRVSDVYEAFSHSTTFTFGGGATTASKTLNIIRQDRQVTVHLPNSVNMDASATTTGAMDSNTDLPTRLFSVTDHQTWGFVRDGGTNNAGYVKVTSGNIQIGKNANDGFVATSGGNNGIENGVAITYITA